MYQIEYELKELSTGINHKSENDTIYYIDCTSEELPEKIKLLHKFLSLDVEKQLVEQKYEIEFVSIYKKDGTLFTGNE